MEKKSVASERKHVTSNCTQTEVPLCADVLCQIPDKHNIQVQTDTSESTENIFAECNLNSLLLFLKKVTPHVCSVLQRNIESKAFDRYEMMSDEGSTTISRLHLLEKSSVAEQLSCSCVSWNSVGTAIAAGYSSTDHKDWCEHGSSVDLWSLSRKDFDPKKPNLTLETDCCITYVSFHTQLPAVIVAGKLNGEILLWDISKEDDPLLGSTATALFNHREPITGLHWLLSFEKSDKIEFASCSLDGKILVWHYENDSLVLDKGFIILAKHLPRNFLIKTRKDNAEIGITAMSINTEDRSIFIIGVEGGGIFQCSFDSLEPAAYSSFSTVPLKNPINMGFERHKGQVTSIQFSPFSRNVFLSTGSDGELRIYSLLQPKPLLTLHLPTGGINAAQWSPVRPFVLSCVCNSGQFHVWDLVENEKSPIESNSLTVDRSSGLALQHNRENVGLLATSSSDGTIQVWELSGAILVPKPGEEQKLQTLSKNID